MIVTLKLDLETIVSRFFLKNFKNCITHCPLPKFIWGSGERCKLRQWCPGERQSPNMHFYTPRALKTRLLIITNYTNKLL